VHGRGRLSESKSKAGHRSAEVSVDLQAQPAIYEPTGVRQPERSTPLGRAPARAPASRIARSSPRALAHARNASLSGGTPSTTTAFRRAMPAPSLRGGPARRRSGGRARGHDQGARRGSQVDHGKRPKVRAMRLTSGLERAGAAQFDPISGRGTWARRWGSPILRSG
jgi:hypothetical protein